MSFAPSTIGFGKKENLLVLLAGWAVFGAMFGEARPSSGRFAAWVLLAGVFSFVSLRAIGYFDRYSPRPELSGVVCLLFALPCAGLAAQWLGSLPDGAPAIRPWEAFRASFWVACLFEAAQWAIFKLQSAVGKKWVLAAYLLPEDLERLTRAVQRSGSSGWVDIRPVSPEGDPPVLEGHETLVVSRPTARDMKRHPEFVSAHLRGQRIVDVVQLLKEFRGRVDLGHPDAWTFLLGSTYQSFFIRFYFRLKEISEPFLALALLVLSAPLLLLLAAAVRFSGGGPAVYRQRRVGYLGKTFELLKFRTMTETAESDGPRWAARDDPRVTPLGRWLRKTRLDELPQLVNVLKGELSFVGPRPERPEFYAMLNGHIPLFHLRLLVRPGVSGWAQIMQGYAAGVEESKTKLEYDLFYIQNMSPSLDLRVVVGTAALMLGGGGGR